ncbi:MAG: efflux RND transporter periplasmic adaptor subunit [bacterium]
MTESTGSRKWTRLAAGALVVLLLAALGVVTAPGSGEDDSIRHTTVIRGPMDVTVTGPGRVRAASAVEIEVPRRIGGTLQLVFLIEEGTVVEAGQVVARLDTTDAVEELETAIDELETVQAEYEQLLVDHANSIKDLENAVRSAELSYQQAELRLASMEFSSELEKQQGRLDLEKARIGRAEAERKLEAQRTINAAEQVQKRIELEGAREEVEEERGELRTLTIRAPTDGLVIHAEEGRFMDRTKVREGDQVRERQELIELPDLSILQVTLTVNELDAQRVEVGQRAIVRLDAYPRDEFPGHVIEMSTLAQELSDESNVKVFPAVVELDEPDERIRPGMTASAEIVVDRVENALQAPLAALGTGKAGTCVKPVGADEPIPVRVGLNTESVAQILEGVEEGQRLELAWAQDPAAVLGRLAGWLEVPDAIVRRITAQGDEYGRGSGADTKEMTGGGAGAREGRGGRGGMRSFDPSRMTPEMRQRFEQMRGQRPAGGDAPGEGERPSFRPADMDSLIGVRTLETLKEHVEGLPEGLREEAQGYIEAGRVDLRAISAALQDSLRSWRSRSRPDGTVPPGSLEVEREPEGGAVR